MTVSELSSDSGRERSDDSVNDLRASATPVMFVAEEVLLALDKLGSPYLRLKTGHEDGFSVPPPYVTELMQLPSVRRHLIPGQMMWMIVRLGITSVGMPGESATGNINIAKKSKGTRF